MISDSGLLFLATMCNTPAGSPIHQSLPLRISVVAAVRLRVRGCLKQRAATAADQPCIAPSSRPLPPCNRLQTTSSTLISRLLDRRGDGGHVDRVTWPITTWPGCDVRHSWRIGSNYPIKWPTAPMRRRQSSIRPNFAQVNVNTRKVRMPDLSPGPCLPGGVAQGVAPRNYVNYVMLSWVNTWKELIFDPRVFLLSITALLYGEILKKYFITCLIYVLLSNDFSINCVLLYFVKRTVLCKIMPFCVAVESLPPPSKIGLPLPNLSLATVLRIWPYTYLKVLPDA